MPTVTQHRHELAIGNQLATALVNTTIGELNPAQRRALAERLDALAGGRTHGGRAMWFLLDLLLIFGEVAFLGFCGWRLVHKASSKGYRSPMVGVLVLIGVLIGFFVGLDTHEQTEPFLVTSARTLSGGLLACLLAGSVIWMLPRKDPRRPGPRKIRFPYRLAGCALVAVALLLGPPTNFKLVAPSIALASLCFWVARRAGARPLEDVLGADPRAPVLYLRPFEHEQYAFAMIPWGRRQTDFCAPQTTYRLFDVRSPNLTFEQYFSEDLRLTLGPLVALGNPRDFVPPIGAARTYASDEGWEDAFKSLARNAACILSNVDISPSLSRELRYLREAGLHEKLFILTAPHLAAKRPSSFRQRAFLLFMRFNDKLMNWLKARPPWGKFTATLRGLGYTINIRAPKPGTVLTFDKHGTAILLRTGACTAREYIQAMQTWITEKRIPGKSTRSTLSAERSGSREIK